MNMTLVQMSFSGTVLIMAIILIRTLAVHRLPKQTFLILWGLALLRLLVPFTIPSTFSIYSTVFRNMPDEILSGISSQDITDENSPLPAGADTSALTGIISPDAATYNRADPAMQDTDVTLSSTPHTPVQSPGQHDLSAPACLPRQALFIVWCTGTVLCAAFFVLSYLRCRLEFSTSLPVTQPYVNQWLACRHSMRTVSARQSDHIGTPLTYGILHPVILLPKQTDWTDTLRLQYILTHEYVHIRRLDAVTKLLAALALCLHWFNPFVWVMYLLFNRDLELSCDEKVVRHFGENSRSAYARMLIDMEAKKSGLMPFCNHFGKNAIEERITAIMKLKKISRPAMFSAAGLILCIAVIFATSATYVSAAGNAGGPASRPEDTTDMPDPSFTEEEYDGCESALNLLTQSERLTQITEDTIALVTDCYDQANAQIDCFRQLSDDLGPYLPLGLTLQYDSERNYLHMYFQGKEVRGIYDEQKGIYISQHLGTGAGLYDKNPVELYTVYENGKLTALREATAQEMAESSKQRRLVRDNFLYYERYRILAVPGNEKPEEAEALPEETESRINQKATVEDYRSCFALMSQNYADMSVADFNSALLDWANKNFDSYERILEDGRRNDFQVDLSAEELAFVNLTISLSGEENFRRIQSLKTGRPEEAPVYRSYQFDKEEENGLIWCGFDYSFSYHISDADKVTIGERDRLVGSAIQAIQQFWEETDLAALQELTKEDVLRKLEEIAGRCSSRTVTITILEDQLYFEHMDERVFGT